MNSSSDRPAASGAAPSSVPSREVILRVLRTIGLKRSMAGMAALGLTSILLNIAGPILLGKAIDIIFAGVLGRTFDAAPAGSESPGRMSDDGQGPLADLLRSADFEPGQGIDTTAVTRMLALTFVVYAISGLCWVLQNRRATIVIQMSAHRLRTAVEAKLERLPLSRLEGARRGDLLSRVTNDIDNIAQTMQQTLSQLTNSALLIVGLISVMFWLSPLLSLIALIVVPSAIALTSMLGKRSQPEFDAQWQATGEMSAFVEEIYSGHAIVKGFDQQDRVAAEFRDRNARLRGPAQRAQVLSGAIQPSMNFINNLGYVLIAVIGCLRVLSGGITLGELQAFIIYSRQLSGPLTQVTSLVGVVQSGVASARRVFELLDEQEETDDDALPAGAGSHRGVVSFESVRFSYEADRPLIEDLSLSAEPGTTVAIVGPTGAGKTTLVNLLMRFYEPTAGRICLDGRDIRTMTRRELRSAIGLVLQEPWLFSGTIAENIAYGREGATRAEVEAAAASAHVDHIIQNLPRGYDTQVDEGAGISAGERQLITIARAFLADPVVLALDEATSSVDTRTEVLVRRAMERLRKGRTCFVIAHRLSTIRDSNLILVMNKGAVVESGTHADLLARNGPYSELYRAQYAEGDALPAMRCVVDPM
ncbi:MAG TPA: ABC transporter ATP-binding protein [Actinoplanes sp.]|nr:ABC transporter ATP-binding protein [Actinoplanes sp.]